MVAVPLALRPPSPASLFHLTPHSPFSLPCRFPRAPAVAVSSAAAGRGGSGNGATRGGGSGAPERGTEVEPRTLFPGGFKRPEIRVPALVLRVTPEEVLSAGDAVANAVAKGAVGVVVLDACDDAGRRAYEAARALKGVVGDRAYLLVAERVDVASAVGASGVLLSDAGIPAIIARQMLTKSNSDNVYLPLVGRNISSPNSAISASSSEGADFLIFTENVGGPPRDLQGLVSLHIKVPIFINLECSYGDEAYSECALKLLRSGASGIVAPLSYVTRFMDKLMDEILRPPIADKVTAVNSSVSSKLEAESSRTSNTLQKQTAGFTKIDEKILQMIETERNLLNEATFIIRKAAPMMKEVSLLADAVACLSEPFLLVIVGEFNSGKSTVINALLGRRYLKEGVIPTTNEITLLSYSDVESDEPERCERHPDGQFICYISSPLLKEMNFVDTPGTNVILQRQQRLTEEFVPRADLILFILSADRPLTDSEVAFLRYVQQWKKKVVFVLNKMDIYRSKYELEEAVSFVKENAQKLLNSEDVMLIPISARSALEAKISSSLYNEKYKDGLLDDPRWRASNFCELENFLLSFLDGSTDNGKERVRLKLETPLGISDRLLSSCERLVKLEYDKAIEDMTSIKDVLSSANGYASKMEAKIIPWRKRVLSLIVTAKSRVTKLLESTLQLSNVDLISSYTFKGERISSKSAAQFVETEILQPALHDAKVLIDEYTSWLQLNTADEAKFYKDCFSQRWRPVVDLDGAVQLDHTTYFGNEEMTSKEVLQSFNVSAVAKAFEQEIRDVALGTFGGLGAAGLSASLLTSVLPSTVEDLFALAFCSAGGFVAISNFPGRRKKAIEKVTSVANALASKLEDAMEKDLAQSAGKLSSFVETVSNPYLESTQERIDRFQGIQDELAAMERKLHPLKIEVRNLFRS